MSVVLGIHYGISSGQHDVGACLVINGTLKHFIEEERLLRVKTARGKLPIYSIKKILELEKISMRDIDLVVFPGKTYKKNYDTIKSFLNHYFGHAPKLMAIEHHLAHLASAFFHSNFENSVILSIDGVESVFLGSDFISINSASLRLLSSSPTESFILTKVLLALPLEMRTEARLALDWVAPEFSMKS